MDPATMGAIGSEIAPYLAVAGGAVLNWFTGEADRKAEEEAQKRNLILAIWQQQQNQKNADRNYQLQVDSMDYQKALNEELMAREDTSYQRTVNDMRNAGLNPLTMSGLNGSSGSVAGYSAPQKEYTPLEFKFQKIGQNLQQIDILKNMFTTLNEIQNYQIGTEKNKQETIKTKLDNINLGKVNFEWTNYGKQERDFDFWNKIFDFEDKARQHFWNEYFNLHTGMSDFEKMTQYYANQSNRDFGKLSFKRANDGTINEIEQTQNDKEAFTNYLINNKILDLVLKSVGLFK